MARIDWSSLIADPAGQIDYVRVRQLVSVLLAVVAGVILALAMANIVAANEVLAMGAGMLVVPLTIGKAVDGLRGAADRRETRAIIAGQVPGRRAVDTPPAGGEEGA
jgi:hypothetical protein